MNEKCKKTGRNKPTRPVDLRGDGVGIDLPSREEIKGALNYLKNNKATTIAAELLKNAVVQ
jgi:hypothetical protein